MASIATNIGALEAPLRGSSGREMRTDEAENRRNQGPVRQCASV